MADYLLIHNYAPGTVNQDIDESPTLALLDKPEHDRFRKLCSAPRPEFELFDVHKDPAQLNNLANDPAHAATRDQLIQRLTRTLIQRGDPRALGNEKYFETAPTTRPVPKNARSEQTVE